MNPVLLFAFTAGAVATVNPCGVAMLPLWFAQRSGAGGSQTPAARLARAILAGLGATLGFLIVFALAGGILAAGASWLGTVFPIAGFSVGVGLALVGGLSLTGIKLAFVPGANACRRVNTRHGSIVFGISFGLVSMSCTLPIFLAALSVSMTGTWVDSAFGLLAYTAGMGTVLTLIGLLATVLRGRFSGLTALQITLLQRFGGGLVLLAGLFIAFYWGRVLFGDPTAQNGLVSFSEGVSSTLNIWLTGVAGRWLTGILFVLLAGSGVGIWLFGRTQKPPGSSDNHDNTA